MILSTGSQIWWHTSHGDILAFHTFLCYEPCKKGRAQKVERVENVQKVQMVWILDFRWPRRFIWSMKCNKSLNKKLQLLPILNKICLKRGQPSMRAVVRWEPAIYFVTVWEILSLHLATTILLCPQCETEIQHISFIAAWVNKIHWTLSETIWYELWLSFGRNMYPCSESLSYWHSTEWYKMTRWCLSVSKEERMPSFLR